MTAMGIIGIILASAMALVLVGATVYALYSEMLKEKRKHYNALIDHAIDHSAFVYEMASRDLIKDVLQDTTEMIPEMVGTLTKAYEKMEV